MVWNTIHLCTLEILFNDPEYHLLWLPVDLACLKSWQRKPATPPSILLLVYIFRMDRDWMDLDFGGGGLDWIGQQLILFGIGLDANVVSVGFQLDIADWIVDFNPLPGVPGADCSYEHVERYSTNQSSYDVDLGSVFLFVHGILFPMIFRWFVKLIMQTIFSSFEEALCRLCSD